MPYQWVEPETFVLQIGAVPNIYHAYKNDDVLRFYYQVDAPPGAEQPYVTFDVRDLVELFAVQDDAADGKRPWVTLDQRVTNKAMWGRMYHIVLIYLAATLADIEGQEFAEFLLDQDLGYPSIG